jgi:hypothetical protein
LRAQEVHDVPPAAHQVPAAHFADAGSDDVDAAGHA